MHSSDNKSYRDGMLRLALPWLFFCFWGFFLLARINNRLYILIDLGIIFHFNEVVKMKRFTINVSVFKESSQEKSDKCT